MGKIYNHITQTQEFLIKDSVVFFVATADPELKDTLEGLGPINLSPKGYTRLHVLSKNRVAYLDFPGSGNQTAGQILKGSPVTLMVMSMDSENSSIVRLFGTGKVFDLESHPDRTTMVEDSEWAGKPRQVIEVMVNQTQTSCGYGVPKFKLLGQRSLQDRGRKYKDPLPL